MMGIHVSKARVQHCIRFQLDERIECRVCMIAHSDVNMLT